MCVRVCMCVRICVSFPQGILFGALSGSVTKEKKEAQWDDITTTIRLQCPDELAKDKAKVRKRWNNVLADAKADHSKYLKCTRGTGNCIIVFLLFSLFVFFSGLQVVGLPMS